MNALRIVQATYLVVFAAVFVSNILLGPSRIAFLALASVVALVGALLLGNVLGLAEQQAEQAARGARWAPPALAPVAANRGVGAFFLFAASVMALLVSRSELSLLP